MSRIGTHYRPLLVLFVLTGGLLLGPSEAKAQQPEAREATTVFEELEQIGPDGALPPALLESLAERHPDRLSPAHWHRLREFRARTSTRSAASAKAIPSALDVVNVQQRLSAESWPRSDLNFRPFTRAWPAGDVDGDGVNDWIYVYENIPDNRTSDLGDVTTKTFLRLGGGTFSTRYFDQEFFQDLAPAGTLVGSGGTADAVAVGDSELRIFEGASGGYTDTGTTFSVSNPGTPHPPTDLDGDGFDDLILTNAETITVLFGGPTPTDVDIRTYAPTFRKDALFSYTAGDVEEDGDGEIVRFHGNTTRFGDDDSLGVDVFEIGGSRNLGTAQSFNLGLTARADLLDAQLLNIDGTGFQEIYLRGQIDEGPAFAITDGGSGSAYDSTPIGFDVNAAPTGDVNDDGRSDFLLRRENGTYVGFGPPNLADGLSNDVQLPQGSDESLLIGQRRPLGDLTGDGSDDFLVRVDGPSQFGVRRVEISGGTVTTAEFLFNSADYERTDIRLTTNIGDWNGDGSDDTAFLVSDGTIELYFGDPTQAITPDRTFSGPPPLSPSTASGDFTGNGQRNFVVVRDTSDATVAVYETGAGTNPIHTFSAQDLGIPPDAEDDVPATVVANVGDVNDDGTDDLGVAVPDVGTPDTRKAYLFRGQPALSSQPDVTIDYSDDGASQFVGSAIESLGDINGDGVDDFAVADIRRRTDAPLTGGGVYVHFGQQSNAKLPSFGPPDEILTPEADPDEVIFFFPWGMAVGDFNGDGTPDLATKAAIFRDQATGGGAKGVQVYHGGRNFNDIPDQRLFVPGFMHAFSDTKQARRNLGELTTIPNVSGGGTDRLLLGSAFQGEGAVVYATEISGTLAPSTALRAPNPRQGLGFFTNFINVPNGEHSSVGDLNGDQRPTLLLPQIEDPNFRGSPSYTYSLGPPPGGARFGITGRVTITGTNQGVQGVQVALSGDTSATATTNAEGRYSFLVGNGTYTLTPSSSGQSFTPVNRQVTVSGSAIRNQNFSAQLANPALALSGFQVLSEQPGNDDGTVNPGEFLDLELSITNTTDSTITGAYARMDSTFDTFVHPIAAYRFSEIVQARTDLGPNTSARFQERVLFHVAGNTPDGHVLEVPMRLFNGNDRLLGRDTLAVPVKGTDTTAPQIRDFHVNIQPGFVPTGDPVTITAFVTEGSEQVTVQADVESPDESLVQMVTLVDDGSGADQQAGDRRFTGQFVPQQKTNFFVDITATDGAGNTGGFENATFTSVPFAKTGKILVVADNGRPWRDNFESEYVGALQANGFSPDVWSVYQRGVPPVNQMGPYKAVVWFTGRAFGLDVDARDAIAQYLGGGGKLMVSGENIARRSQNASWLGQTLRAEFVQHNVDRFEVEGVAGDPVSDGLVMPLDRDGVFSDEIDPTNGGTAALMYDNTVTHPTSKSAAKARPRSRSVVQRCGWQHPTSSDRTGCQKRSLEGRTSEVERRPSRAVSRTSAKAVQSSGTAAIRFSDGTQQLVYLAFGLEAVARSSDQSELMRRTMSWFGLERGSIGGRVTVAGTNRGVQGVTVTLSGDSSATATTDATGRYRFVVEDGSYTITASASKFDFNPASRSITVSGGSQTGQDFVAVLATPALTLDAFSIDFESPGNNDGTANPGEFLHVTLSVSNGADSTITGAYARMDSTTDSFVHPLAGYFFDNRVEAFRNLSANTTKPFRDRFSMHLAAGTAPSTPVQVPIAFFDGEDRLVGQDTLEMSVQGTDTTPPSIRGFNVDIEPGFVPTGTPDTISAFVTEASPQVTVEADVKTPNDQVVATITLRDDGSGADETAGDRRFSGTFTPQQEAQFFVDLSATDAATNTGGFDDATLTSVPFAKRGDVLLIADNRRPWTDDFRSVYTGALQANGFSPDVWSVYQRGVPTASQMDQYDAAIWFTGRFRGIGRRDEREAIADYLDDRGGKLLVAGREIAEDLQRRDRTWLEQHLHAAFVQGRVDRFEADGVSGDPITDGFGALSLTFDGSDADEVDPTAGATAILTYDDTVTQPKIRSGETGRGEPRRCGWQSNEHTESNTCEPGGRRAPPGWSPRFARGGASTGPAKTVQSSGTAGLRFQGSQQRLVYLTFGLEAVRSTSARNQLAGRALDWLIPGAGCPLSWALDVTGEDANGNSQTLTLGQGRNATAGVDAICNEQELGSTPSGTDLRFTGTDLTGVDLGNGTRTDIRPNFTTTGTPKATGTSARATWRIDLQAVADPITLAWDETALVDSLPNRRVQLVDAGTGGTEVNVDMKQNGTASITTSSVDAVHVRIDPPVTRTIETTASDWELLSVPVRAQPRTFQSLLGSLCQTGFFFDADNGYRTIGDDQVLPVGRGGFFKCTASTASVTGQVAAPTVSVKEGWNIIGAFEDTVAVGNVTTKPAGMTLSEFFAFDSQNGFVAVNELVPGGGYWVKAGEAGTLTLTGGKRSRTAAAPSASSHSQALEGVDLEVTDAEGRNTTLHFEKTLSDQERRQYVRPPTPPPAIFDVRFATGDVATSLSGSEGSTTSRLRTVDVQGATFPLAFRLETQTGKDRALRLVAGGTEYRLTSGNPSVTVHQDVEKVAVGATVIPADFALNKSQPNPTAGPTILEYALPKEAGVTLEVYDILGRRVARLVDEQKRAGVHRAQLDASRLPSGVYFVRMQTVGFQKTRRLTVVK